MSDKKHEAFSITKIVPSVDWLSGTAREPNNRDAVSKIAHEYLNQQIELGFEPSLWKSFRYEGWRINGASWGKRDEDDIITFSGSKAETNWANVAMLLDTCSRLDLAVTVWYKNHDVNLASRAYQALKAKAEQDYINRGYTYMTNLLGGDTIYVGSRKSTYFGRLYDKCLQSNDLYFANSWRWEVEYHKPQALLMLQTMAISQNIADFILLHVRNWFTERGIDCPFDPSMELIAVEPPKRAKTKDEQTLQWLRESVANSVTKLADKGKARDVLEALGLSGYADELFRKKISPRKKGDDIIE